MEPTNTSFKSVFFVGFNWMEMLQLILLILGIVFISKFIYKKIKNRK